MKINYGSEYATFRAEQKKQREYYLSVCMSEEAIAEIEKFDKQEFLRELAYKRNTIPLDALTPFEKDDESKNPLYDKNFYRLTVSIETDRPQTRNGWIDQIENPKVLEAIRHLTEEQLELLTLLVFEERDQGEIAEILGITQGAISQRFATIKKIFQRIFEET